MNSEIKKLVKPELFNAFLELSKDDIILQQVMKRTDSVEEFINALLAATLCMLERDNQVQQMLVGILNANPEVKKLLELKNDPSLLYKE